LFCGIHSYTHENHRRYLDHHTNQNKLNHYSVIEQERTGFLELKVMSEVITPDINPLITFRAAAG
jgi:hypothetical protein